MGLQEVELTVSPQKSGAILLNDSMGRKRLFLRMVCQNILWLAFEPGPVKLFPMNENRMKQILLVKLEHQAEVRLSSWYNIL